MVQLERPGLLGVFEPPGPVIVVVSAPAGFGKTALVRQWFDRQEGRRGAWVAAGAAATAADLAAAVEKARAELGGDGVLVVDGLATAESLRALEPLTSALAGARPAGPG